MRKLAYTLTFIGILVLGLTSCRKEAAGPKACFTTPDEITAGEAIAFSSACSNDADTYLWSFGDGSVSEEANPQYTYMAAGNFLVSLTVTDVNGNSDESSMNITVLPPEYIEHSGEITSDETWYEGLHVITGNLTITSATLTIEPGAVVHFNAGTEMRVGYSSSSTGATLLANGTAEKPILFTSGTATKSAGDWDFMGFYAGASNLNSLKYCTVEYGGGYSNTYGMIYIDESAVSIENCNIRHSEFQGVVAASEGFFSSFQDNVLSDNGLSDVQVFANHAHTIGTGNDFQTDKGIAVRGDNIESAAVTWLKQNTPYILMQNVNVGSATGSVLTLEPGVVVALGSSVEMRFGYQSGSFGNLVAEGTQSEQIVFTSAAPAGSGANGDWDFIGFYSGAGTGNRMDWCVVEYGGGYSNSYGMIYLDGSSLSLTNSTIRFSQYQGIVLTADASFTACTGNTFENNTTAPIQVYGNFAHTIQAGNTFNTGPGILVKGDNLEQSEASWVKNDVPWIIDGNLILGSASGAKLVVEAGATLAFTSGSEMRVGYASNTFGILEAVGSPGELVTFTSAAPQDFAAAGDWDGIWFYGGTSGGTILDYCVVEYGGGYSDNSGNLVVDLDKPGLPTVSNSQIRNSGAWGIYLRDNNASPTLTDNIYSNNALGDVRTP